MEKWRNQRKWLTRTRTIFGLISILSCFSASGGGWFDLAQGKGREMQHTAGEYEDWIAQFDDGEVAQVAHVDCMAADAQRGEEEWEAIDCREEHLGGDDAVDEAGEEFAREHGVLFD